MWLEKNLGHVKDFGLHSKCGGKPLEQVNDGMGSDGCYQRNSVLGNRLTGGRGMRETMAGMAWAVLLGYFSSQKRDDGGLGQPWR